MVKESLTLTAADVWEHHTDKLKEHGYTDRVIERAQLNIDFEDPRDLQSLSEGSEQATATAIRHANKHHGRTVTQSEILNAGEELAIIGDGKDQYSRATVRKAIKTLYSHMLVDRERVNRGRSEFAYELSDYGQLELNRLGEYNADVIERSMNQKHEVLKAIDTNGRLSLDEIVTETTLSRSQIHQAMSELRKANAIQETGHRYVITNGNGKLLLDTWNGRFEAGFETLPNGMWNTVISDSEAYKTYQ